MNSKFTPKRAILLNFRLYEILLFCLQKLQMSVVILDNEYFIIWDFLTGLNACYFDLCLLSMTCERNLTEMDYAVIKYIINDKPFVYSIHVFSSFTEEYIAMKIGGFVLPLNFPEKKREWKVWVFVHPDINHWLIRVLLRWINTYPMSIWEIESNSKPVNQRSNINV